MTITNVRILMPIPGCFFCGSSKKDLAVTVPFKHVRVLGNPVVQCELTPLVKQCETVFGIKSSKLALATELAIFHTTGFQCAYGITYSQTPGEVRVVHHTALNDFLTATTIIEKKRCFFSACKNFFELLLLEKFKSDPLALRVFEPIKEYCLQCFDRTSFPFLTENKQKNESRAAFITRLKTLARCIDQFILTSTSLENIKLHKHITKEDLTYSVERWDAITPLTESIPTAAQLGYRALLTRAEAISQTLQLIQEKQHDDSLYSPVYG